MMEKPKKERRFLKTLGRVGEILIQEVLLKVGSNLIKRIGGKKQIPSILFLFLSISLYGQFPININKQRLGFQTTADGLVWRGSISDTASIQPVSNQNAWVILDTVNLKIYSFDFTSNVWNQVGGSAFTQPIDSLFFKTSVPPNNVDTAKMRWDSELGTVVLGMYDAVPNELGFKNFWLVKNQTGSTITKGSLVYANGTVGASGRITVAKFISNGTIDAKYLLGITAHDLTDGEDGYVISFGKIRQVNTDTFAAGAILYPSPTVAGVWTDVEPIAPNLDMPIGFCINSSSNNGTIAIRVASGYKLNELHDVAISSPVSNASLYYSGGLWRDTTPTLLVSDTASMLANYATKAYADTTGRLYARQDYTTGVTTSTLTWTQTDTLIPGGVTFIQVYRNGQILLPSQYTVPTSTSVVIAASSFRINDNYTVIFPRGGGAGSGGGSGSLTSISGGTGIIVNPNPITTTGTVSADLSVLMELTDTSLLNLTTRFASKLNLSDTVAMLTPYFRDADTTLLNLTNRFNTKLNISDTTNMLSPYFRDADTSSLNLTSRFALKLNAADTASLSSRINTKGTVSSVATGFGLLGGTITTTGTLVLDSAVVFTRIRDSIVDVAIGNDTIKILKQEYAPATTSVLTWTITPKFPIQLKTHILVFRNGQLLNNDQYNLTDTNKITIVSTSFKVGANYTVATVSGIGSIGTGVFPNPVYPEAGIALSTGSAWASSIPNNSNNWNIAYNDKINNAVFTGTNTKTLTLTQLDGGTITAPFTDLQGVTSVTAGTGLTGGTITTTGTVAVDFGVVAPLANPTFTGTVGGITKTMVGLGNVDNTSDANKPISTATQTALNLKLNISDAASTYVPLNNESTMNATLNINGNLNMGSGGTVSTPILSAGTIIKQGGTTLQFLKANGDVDSNTYLRTGLADSSYQLKLTNPVTGTGTTNTLPLFTGTSTLGNSIVQQSNNNIGINTTPFASLTLGQGKNIMLDASSNNVPRILFYESFDRNENDVQFGAKIQYHSINDRLEFVMRDSFAADPSGDELAISIVRQTGNTTIHKDLTVSGSITEGGNNVLTSADTTTMLEPYIEQGDTATMLNPYWRSDKYSGTLPITNGGTGAESASVARTTLGVGYTFFSTTTGATIIFSANRVSLVITGTGSTTSIDLTTATSGRQYMIKNLSNATVISSASNVIPLAGGSAGTAILGAGNVTPQWCTLVADGTNWHIMQAN
jgi:hypothetical protein